jgi:hypothetical protein
MSVHGSSNIYITSYNAIEGHTNTLIICYSKTCWAHDNSGRFCDFLGVLSRSFKQCNIAVEQFLGSSLRATHKYPWPGALWTLLQQVASLCNMKQRRCGCRYNYLIFHRRPLVVELGTNGACQTWRFTDPKLFDVQFELQLKLRLNWTEMNLSARPIYICFILYCKPLLLPVCTESLH